jgi:Spy/CpxP family protein refolding chaperone
MKSITKIVLISGLLASSMAMAGSSPDNDSRKASRDCHHGAHSGMKGGGMDRAEKGEKFLNRMTDRLQLTTEQRSSVQALLQKSQPKRISLKEKMQVNRKALKELARSGKSDSSQIAALAQERGQLVADMIVQRSKVRGEIQQILTDAQREQLNQMRERSGHHNKG